MLAVGVDTEIARPSKANTNSTNMNSHSESSNGTNRVFYNRLYQFRLQQEALGVDLSELQDYQWGHIPLEKCHHISITTTLKDAPQSYRVRICKTCCQENTHIELGTYVDQESAILVNDTYEILQNRFDKLIVLRKEDRPFLHLLTAKKYDRAKGKDYASILDLLADRLVPSENRKRKLSITSVGSSNSLDDRVSSTINNTIKNSITSNTVNSNSSYNSTITKAFANLNSIRKKQTTDDKRARLSETSNSVTDEENELSSESDFVHTITNAETNGCAKSSHKLIPAVTELSEMISTDTTTENDSTSTDFSPHTAPLKHGEEENCATRVDFSALIDSSENRQFNRQRAATFSAPSSYGNYYHYGPYSLVSDGSVHEWMDSLQDEEVDVANALSLMSSSKYEPTDRVKAEDSFKFEAAGDIIRNLNPLSPNTGKLEGVAAESLSSLCNASAESLSFKGSYRDGFSFLSSIENAAYQFANGMSTNGGFVDYEMYKNKNDSQSAVNYEAMISSIRQDLRDGSGDERDDSPNKRSSSRKKEAKLRMKSKKYQDDDCASDIRNARRPRSNSMTILERKSKARSDSFLSDEANSDDDEDDDNENDTNANGSLGYHTKFSSAGSRIKCKLSTANY